MEMVVSQNDRLLSCEFLYVALLIFSFVLS